VEDRRTMTRGEARALERVLKRQARIARQHSTPSEKESEHHEQPGRRRIQR
jgi:hypothetical protein